MPPARTADTMWSRLGRGVSESAPVARFNDVVLHHRWVLTVGEFLKGLGLRLLDIFYPVVMILRGLRRASTGGKTWWDASTPEKRKVQTSVVLIIVVMLALMPYGRVLLVIGFVCWLGWLGRDTERKGADPETEGHITRLQAVYNGLVPYLHDEHDPDEHFKPGGCYRDAFTAWEFDEHDRLVGFKFDYSEYVRDGETECRSKVERAIEGKVGRGNEFLYDWDEEGNHLEVRVLPPLPGGLAAQPWPVAEIEYVLGITDQHSAGRLMPVLLPEEPGAGPEAAASNARTSSVPAGWRSAIVAPVVWRVGSPCPNPHLLVTGPSGSGKTTVLRSLLGQALGRGQQVAVIDMEQTEAYEDLKGRRAVRGVIEDPERALELLDWFGLECERRAERRRLEAEAVANEDTALIPTVKVRDPAAPATQIGAGPEPESEPGLEAEIDEPTLWLCIDGLPEFVEAAAALGRPNMQESLAALARKARYADVLLLATAREDQVLDLRPALRAQLTVRVALGVVDHTVSTALFGGTLELGGSRRLPPGRGYARVGKGPVVRLQAPYVPPATVAPLRAIGTTAQTAPAPAPKLQPTGR